MRVLRLLPSILLLLSLPLSAQQATPQPQDPQAVTILNQALTAGGGLTAIKAIADYTGLGTITYHSNPDVQGTVTVKGLGNIAFRIDATLPKGVRSSAIDEGISTTKYEDGKLSAATNSQNAPSSDAFPYQTPLFPGSLTFPYRQLATVLGNPSFGVSYKGVVQVDGHSTHDIQVQRVSQGPDPMRQYHAREFFIDTTTFQVAMTQDLVPKNSVRQIHYSNYATVSGLLVPMSLAEKVSGLATWSIQLNQVTFNSGLQDSAFVLQ